MIAHRLNHNLPMFLKQWHPLHQPHMGMVIAKPSSYRHHSFSRIKLLKGLGESGNHLIHERIQPYMLNNQPNILNREHQGI